VRDEDERDAVARLHLLQQVQDLGTNRDVEGRDGLIADDEVGLPDQRARDRDALALAAGEFVRPTMHHQFGIKPDRPQNLGDAPLSHRGVRDTVDDQCIDPAHENSAD
jgi:hypothetical protein